MNKITFIAGGVVLLSVIVVVALIKSRGAASASGEEETAPSVVTVQTNALQLATLHRYVQGYGLVEPARATSQTPPAEAALAAPAAGVVTVINAFEGEQVEKGDLLVDLNSQAAQVAVENAKQEVGRQKKLLTQQNTSVRSLQEAETQLAAVETQLAGLRMTAPLSGTVTRINVKLGQAVDLNTVVAEVMDLNRLAVSAQIPAAEAGELRPGQTVELLTSPPVATELSFVSPSVDRNNDTVMARAPLPAKSGLRPGQFVPLRVVTVVHTNCLAAPGESVVTDEGGKSVIALVHGDEATRRPVQTSLRENGWVEISAPGLKPGDAVVTVGAYGLPEKTKIRIENSPGDETSPSRPPPDEVRHAFVFGPVRHEARVVHHVHRGGAVSGGRVLRDAHALVSVPADGFSARGRAGEQRHHARR